MNETIKFYQRIKRSRLDLTICGSLLFLLLAGPFSPPIWALTVAQPLTAKYVREHPEECSVTVKKNEQGLLAFTMVLRLAEPRYLVAHLEIHHGGKIIAESHSPAFGRKHANTFYFSISPEDLAESKFDLSQSELGGSGENAVPIPGTIIHQLQLREFVPESLLK